MITHTETHRERDYALNLQLHQAAYLNLMHCSAVLTDITMTRVNATPQTERRQEAQLLQRKSASNIALSYGAKSILIC